MSLTLIVGPMKSGKSLELIARMSEFQHSTLNSVLVHPKLNVREEKVRSRLGPELDALKLDSLRDLDCKEYDVIGVDEAFMFPLEDVDVIKDWLINGKQVLLSSLDMSAMGNLVDFIKRVYLLKPDEIILKTAVCESCKSFGAQFTQILKRNTPIKSGLPDVVPDDGTYEYRPVCRACFY